MSLAANTLAPVNVPVPTTFPFPISVPVLDWIFAFSLVLSLAIFVTRVGLKELKAVLGDLFQLIEDVMGRIQHLRKVAKAMAENESPAAPAE